jgi:DNA polymerase-3 subunit beta
MNEYFIKEQFEKQLHLAEKIAGKNQSLPILKCVLLEVSKNGLKIRSTNLDLGIEVFVPAKVEDEGVVAVPADILFSFVSNSTGKNIIFEKENETLKVICGSSETVIKTLPYEDFPTIPKIEPISSFVIRSQDIVKGLKAVWYAAGISAIKPELSSVYVADGGDGIVFAATDSFRLAEKRVHLKKVPQFDPVLIPAKNVGELVRILESEAGEIKVLINKNQISFSSDSLYVTSRLIEGNFPDYKQIIPKEFHVTAVVLKQDLLNALKISNIFSGKSSQVSFSVSSAGKKFLISSKNSDAGEGSTAVAAALQGSDIDINFNQKYITDSIPSIPTDSVTLGLSGPQKPMVLRPVGDGSFTYLVMPMKG